MPLEVHYPASAPSPNRRPRSRMSNGSSSQRGYAGHLSTSVSHSRRSPSLGPRRFVSHNAGGATSESGIRGEASSSPATSVAKWDVSSWHHDVRSFQAIDNADDGLDGVSISDRSENHRAKRSRLGRNRSSSTLASDARNSPASYSPAPSPRPTLSQRHMSAPFGSADSSCSPLAYSPYATSASPTTPPSTFSSLAANHFPPPPPTHHQLDFVPLDSIGPAPSSSSSHGAILHTNQHATRTVQNAGALSHTGGHSTSTNYRGGHRHLPMIPSNSTLIPPAAGPIAEPASASNGHGPIDRSSQSTAADHRTNAYGGVPRGPLSSAASLKVQQASQRPSYAARTLRSANTSGAATKKKGLFNVRAPPPSQGSDSSEAEDDDGMALDSDSEDSGYHEDDEGDVNMRNGGSNENAFRRISRGGGGSKDDLASAIAEKLAKSSGAPTAALAQATTTRSDIARKQPAFDHDASDEEKKKEIPPASAAKGGVAAAASTAFDIAEAFARLAFWVSGTGATEPEDFKARDDDRWYDDGGAYEDEDEEDEDSGAFDELTPDDYGVPHRSSRGRAFTRKRAHEPDAEEDELSGVHATSGAVAPPSGVVAPHELYAAAEAYDEDEDEDEEDDELADDGSTFHYFGSRASRGPRRPSPVKRVPSLQLSSSASKTAPFGSATTRDAKSSSGSYAKHIEHRVIIPIPLRSSSRSSATGTPSAFSMSTSETSAGAASSSWGSSSPAHRSSRPRGVSSSFYGSESVPRVREEREW